MGVAAGLNNPLVAFFVQCEFSGRRDKPVRLVQAVLGGQGTQTIGVETQGRTTAGFLPVVQDQGQTGRPFNGHHTELPIRERFDDQTLFAGDAIQKYLDCIFLATYRAGYDCVPFPFLTLMTQL